MCCYCSLVRMFAEIIRILLYLTRPMSDMCLSFIYNFLLEENRPLPPIKDKILLMSASELADKIRKRELNAGDVVKAYIHRSRLIQSNMNAVVDERYSDALKEARAIDQFLDNCEIDIDEIAKTKPLLGVPFSCEESIGAKGMFQTYGAQEKDRKAEKDSAVVTLYKKAGAINLVTTNVSEFCIYSPTANTLFGRTKNPYDFTREVCGSSGGEAAIISAAGSVVGLGTDFAGSVRISASFCGIYGHKPTSSLIPSQGIFPEKAAIQQNVSDYTCVGPMCRYAEDLPLLLKVLIGDDKRVDLNKEIDFHNVKVYYMEELPGALNSSTDEIKNAIKKASRHFEEKYGTKPVALKIDEMMYAIDMWECKLLEKKKNPFLKALSFEGERVHLGLEFCKYLFGKSKYTFQVLFYAAIERRSKDIVYYQNLESFKLLKQKLNWIFKKEAILLFPTYPEPPPHCFMSIPKYSNFGYTAIFSALGLPVTQIPPGMKCGLPIGIQAVSGRFKDNLTVAAALELDRVFQGWKSPSFVDV